MPETILTNLGAAHVWNRILAGGLILAVLVLWIVWCLYVIASEHARAALENWRLRRERRRMSEIAAERMAADRLREKELLHHYAPRHFKAPAKFSQDHRNTVAAMRRREGAR